MTAKITIALTKGRILKETLPLLERAGVVPSEDIDTSRKLLFATNRDDIQLLVMRGVDVPVYVRHGAADMGVVGKDILLEYGSANIYELLDLGIAPCRLMTAEPNDYELRPGRIRVATKFVNVARDYFAKQGLQVELIKLYGALELAPNLGLADMIVDIVDTGNTLKANGLRAVNEIATVTSRLIVNRASMRSRHKSLEHLINQLEKALG
ncbi:MAG: ATP phosphoribosyltransferase [Pseudomonadota bacterium]